MRAKYKSIFVTLAFVLALEFVLAKYQIWKLNHLLYFIGAVTFILILGIFWVFEFSFKSFSWSKLKTDLIHLILPVLIFWGLLFLLFSFSNNLWRQFIILISSLFFFLIVWSFGVEKRKSIFAFNILSLGTIFTAFLIYSACWAFYLTFNIPLWSLMIVLILVSFLLFYQIVNLFFSFIAHFWLYLGVFVLIIGEVAWSLSFWPTGHLTAGLILTLVFYLLWEFFSYWFEGRMKKSIILEHLLLCLFIFLLILLKTPWFGFLKTLK